MPRTVPGSVSVSKPDVEAMPKSETTMVPSRSSRRFAGLTSRWTIPRRAPGRAPVPPGPATRARARAVPDPRRSRSKTEPPSRYSMTMYGCVPCSPTSKTVMTCGAPESRAADSASRRKRACASSSRACRSESSLTATFRSRTESVARYTSPIPPRAISVADVYRFGSAWLAVVILRSTRPDAKACAEPGQRSRNPSPSGSSSSSVKTCSPVR